MDGRAREARLNHPKGLAIDDSGNIYIADAVNMAIRKISDSGKPYRLHKIGQVLKLERNCKFLGHKTGSSSKTELEYHK